LIYAWCFDDGWYEISVVVDHMESDDERAWCKQNLGYWRARHDPDDFYLIVYFRTEEDATLFKMAFGGEYHRDPFRGYLRENGRL
jgi:hypothetical protein